MQPLLGASEKRARLCSLCDSTNQRQQARRAFICGIWEFRNMDSNNILPCSRTPTKGTLNVEKPLRSSMTAALGPDLRKHDILELIFV